MSRIPSPFLHLGSQTKANSLAIIHLSRDRLQPLYLEEIDGEHDGYAEGAVLNTRFGSFPHSTFINVPWGSQVRASEVDTGSRGRKPQKKRKRDHTVTPTDETAASKGGDTSTEANGGGKGAKKAVAASSGFVHILAPSPELWTTSLPHRTQVVYTPDYSYILQRIRARPGSRLIEAGAGSGSFTHASARAVYNGIGGGPAEDPDAGRGKVFSFEFNEPRYKKMCTEVTAHKLDRIVRVTHRDVYNDGFLVDGKSPGADAVFLDLPKPWEALPHLSRQRYKSAAASSQDGDDNSAGATQSFPDESFISPLNPKKSVHLCTFSPCIEQVSRTVSMMRQLGWMDIETVEIANKRIHVMREKVGLTVTTDRGMAQAPIDVAEAVERLRRIEDRVREHQKAIHDPEVDDVEEHLKENFDDAVAVENNKLPPFMQGRLVTRPESEMRSHTSYLTFAILPRDWTAEDEAAALERWPCGQEKKVIGSLDKAARKQQKREMLESKKGKKKGKANGGGGKAAVAAAVGDDTVMGDATMGPEEGAQHTKRDLEKDEVTEQGVTPKRPKQD
ncbi:tRNA (adenine-N(1)-)-methyltransferase catalytic subunit trm61 [Magnaporthiopsis poae ATCC 64411]|uniref:tRNA (adenine(58)-N(1))-methyltransferase catalytic subunit TRM61 n=1 Tax=Magnaporthiopsis poae (strain ATCC 64411 / 73-15) TaxID=644358 RepID=A0A0C4EA82_MAGP6|nr:tRNA (adenine-N(1)-)-methyltransferase catalytic subunit trm61 [Magnaporthiopsis poae ATCC 64411]